MEFQSSKGIFLQIAENISHQILEGLLKPGDRVPSVRDLAAEFEVNRNTVLRTYAIMSDEGIIENRRGQGFYVATNACDLILTTEKAAFFNHDLPAFCQKVKLLQLTASDLAPLLNQLQANETNTLPA